MFQKKRWFLSLAALKYVFCGILISLLLRKWLFVWGMIEHVCRLSTLVPFQMHAIIVAWRAILLKQCLQCQLEDPRITSSQESPSTYAASSTPLDIVDNVSPSARHENSPWKVVTNRKISQPSSSAPANNPLAGSNPYAPLDDLQDVDNISTLHASLDPAYGC